MSNYVDHFLWVSSNTKKKRENRKLFSQPIRFDLAAYKRFRMKTRGNESLINRSTPRLHDGYESALAIFVLICADYRLISCHHRKLYELCRKWYLNHFSMEKPYLIIQSHMWLLREQFLTWLATLNRLYWFCDDWKVATW